MTKYPSDRSESRPSIQLLTNPVMFSLIGFNLGWLTGHFTELSPPPPVARGHAFFNHTHDAFLRAIRALNTSLAMFQPNC